MAGRPSSQLRNMGLAVGMLSLMTIQQAVFLLKDSRAMAVFPTPSHEHHIWRALESAALSDLLNGACMVFVAIALYRLGKRVDSLTPAPTKHKIWKELA